MENTIGMVSWNRCFEKWLWHESTIIILKDIWTDRTGFNTNPKGGNRLWRTREAWFREIDVLKIKNLGSEGVEYSKTQFLINKFNFFTWKIWKELKSQKIHEFFEYTLEIGTFQTCPCGYMYPRDESIGGQWQVWTVPNSNVNSKNH